jgi:NAD(P)-dependent dehydrogenase (short-subunit alcohol dehydrogenase family)
MKETAMATDFTGRTALITGAGRGIGRATALGLADAGASLILLARSTRQLAETRAVLLARGAAAERIRILPADLGDEEQRIRAAAAALGPGRVDILINNPATVEPLGATAAVPAAELLHAFEVNVVAAAGLDDLGNRRERGRRGGDPQPGSLSCPPAWSFRTGRGWTRPGRNVSWTPAATRWWTCRGLPAVGGYDQPAKCDTGRPVRGAHAGRQRRHPAVHLVRL